MGACRITQKAAFWADGSMLCLLCRSLKVVMADRDISVNELSEKVGRSAVNLSHLRCNRSKGIRISLLEDLCRELHCQPGDLLVYEPPAREEQD